MSGLQGWPYQRPTGTTRFNSSLQFRTTTICARRAVSASSGSLIVLADGRPVGDVHSRCLASRRTNHSGVNRRPAGSARSVREGTHTDLQPDLMIFTAKFYSRTTDTAAQPRPTTSNKIPGKPTLEELQAEWGPFAANAGTYEISGTTLTLRAVVA
jgi:hypothetical protein